MSVIRAARRLMSVTGRPGRYETGFSDLPALANGREVLTSLYKRQIEACESYFPGGERGFNQTVINVARHHLSVLGKYSNDYDVEYEINMGPLERLIRIAEDQLELIDLVNNEFRPSLNFNKAEFDAAVAQNFDPVFGADNQHANLVFHPTPAGVPRMNELGPFPSLPYPGWPYVPPPLGWKYGDGAAKEGWQERAEAWVATLDTPRAKLVSDFMAKYTPEEREQIAAAVKAAEQESLVNFSYSPGQEPAGYLELIAKSERKRLADKATWEAQQAAAQEAINAATGHPVGFVAI